MDSNVCPERRTLLPLRNFLCLHENNRCVLHSKWLLLQNRIAYYHLLLQRAVPFWKSCPKALLRRQQYVWSTEICPDVDTLKDANPFTLCIPIPYPENRWHKEQKSHWSTSTCHKSHIAIWKLDQPRQGWNSLVGSLHFHSVDPLHSILKCKRIWGVIYSWSSKRNVGTDGEKKRNASMAGLWARVGVHLYQAADDQLTYPDTICLLPSLDRKSSSSHALNNPCPKTIHGTSFQMMEMISPSWQTCKNKRGF